MNCEKCNMCYKNINELYEHNLSVHKKINYICNICNTNYKTSSGLYKHNKIKHDNNTYTCEKCNKIFKTFDGYNKHLLTHNEIIKNNNSDYNSDDNIDDDVIEVYDNNVNNINNSNNTIQNSNNNTLQNNSNNTTNNIQNNFYIYPHGKENISLIDDDDIYNFLNNFNCITDYTRLVHCNKKYPQHHSICKTLIKKITIFLYMINHLKH